MTLAWSAEMIPKEIKANIKVEMPPRKVVFQFLRLKFLNMGIGFWVVLVNKDVIYLVGALDHLVELAVEFLPYLDECESSPGNSSD